MTAARIVRNAPALWVTCRSPRAPEALARLREEHGITVVGPTLGARLGLVPSGG